MGSNPPYADALLKFSKETLGGRGCENEGSTSAIPNLVTALATSFLLVAPSQCLPPCSLIWSCLSILLSSFPRTGDTSHVVSRLQSILATVDLLTIVRSLNVKHTRSAALYSSPLQSLAKTPILSVPYQEAYVAVWFTIESAHFNCRSGRKMP